MHPIELTDFLMGMDIETEEGYSETWESMIPDWEDTIEWTIANFQNEVEFVIILLLLAIKNSLGWLKLISWIRSCFFRRGGVILEKVSCARSAIGRLSKSAMILEWPVVLYKLPFLPSFLPSFLLSFSLSNPHGTNEIIIRMCPLP